ncbi:recombination protein NinB [Laribacter hongkongensis]|uniref:recombination protein NinB n=1 Tax=Laribacter hongkongensis TaxID=168471 RepID=UPI001EFC8F17|nr:recombination protein NinB [Laribacter hongkongensis]MCG8990858.1 recombination protein NinB [Laribacter hongkongensis]MCG8997074.1 recombination protein NinB [Laribacter hongkongensis]MCG9001896.1 recombination protein NinB [Laribacter hongkongensis]MCG9003565.1 recombination protein NinB [Laribacter hongkongensis]MCG9008208.1 recombination protein NinB [Laribacter hongkongensis]
MSAHVFHIPKSADVREQMTRAYRAVCELADSGEALEVTVRTKSQRSSQANALMWVRLSELEEQTDWHGIRLTAEEWKDLLSAGLVASKVVPNIDGTGFVIVGQRTSKMSVKQMNELIVLIEAFGAERGVRFSADPRLYREAA